MKPRGWFFGVGALALTFMVASQASAATPVAGLFNDDGTGTLLSDNSAELLINVDGSVGPGGTPTITEGDILVTMVGISTIGPTTIGSGTVYNEVTAFTVVKIATAADVDLGPAGPDDSFGSQNIDLFGYTAVPLDGGDVAYVDWSTGQINTDGAGPAEYTFPVLPGATNDGMQFGAVFEDGAQNYDRDHGIQTGIDTATDGDLRLLVAVDPANGDFASVIAPLDLAGFGTVPSSTAIDNTNIALDGTITYQNWPGLVLNDNITAGNGGFSSPIAGSSWPVFDNLDFTVINAPECCVDIEKEINVDGVWYDHDLCADAPVVPAPHSGEYRLIVTNCGNTVLTSVQINDPTLGIVNVPIADLAPGETRTLTSGDIPALGTQEICMNAGEFPNTASITADCADGPVPSVSDEDSSCLVCEEEELGCRLTGGGVTSDGNWDGTYMDGEDGTNTYQFGGQAGANTALPPQPKGEWEHHQQKGPAGSFSFHAGTASAPAGTEVIEIRCSDPGGCTPSGNPPSPNKQLDFDCVGTFSNIGSGKSAPTWLIAGADVTAEGHGNKTFNGTFHYCEVNVDDLGEGPGPAEPDTADCPSEGFGEKGDPTVPANCDCPDFYRITIYDGVNAADVTFLPDGSIDPTTLNKTDVIYEVDGYLKNGNGLQLHSLTGFDTP